MTTKRCRKPPPAKAGQGRLQFEGGSSLRNNANVKQVPPWLPGVLREMQRQAERERLLKRLLHRAPGQPLRWLAAVDYNTDTRLSVIVNRSGDLALVKRRTPDDFDVIDFPPSLAPAVARLVGVAARAAKGAN